MNPGNEALWVESRRGRFRVGPAPYPSPGPGEIVVAAQALALNPVRRGARVRGLGAVEVVDDHDPAAVAEHVSLLRGHTPAGTVAIGRGSLRQALRIARGPTVRTGSRPRTRAR